VTNLYNADYFRDALDDAINADTSASIWLIDIQNFDGVNQELGFSVGDSVLHCVATTLVAAAPKHSLVCHYAGDRFAVLTHEADTLSTLDDTLSELLSKATSLALFNSVKQEIACRVRVVTTQTQEGESARDVLARANAELMARK
jgi:diguanylate cyclase (GGDEF)-like protein